MKLFFWPKQNPQVSDPTDTDWYFNAIPIPQAQIPYVSIQYLNYRIGRAIQSPGSSRPSDPINWLKPYWIGSVTLLPAYRWLMNFHLEQVDEVEKFLLVVIIGPCISPNTILVYPGANHISSTLSASITCHFLFSPSQTSCPNYTLVCWSQPSYSNSLFHW
jgi:hypothetical protein